MLLDLRITSREQQPFNEACCRRQTIAGCWEVIKPDEVANQIQCHHFRNISLFGFLCMKRMFPCLNAVNNDVESASTKLPTGHSSISVFVHHVQKCDFNFVWVYIYGILKINIISSKQF